MKLFELSKEAESLDSLQHRISLVFAYLVGCLVILLGLSDYLSGLSTTIVLLKIGLSIPYFLGYWVMKRHGHFQLVINVSLLIGHVAMIFNYLYNDGYRGPTIYTFIIFIVAIAILVKGNLRFVWIFFSVLTYCLLFFGEIKGWFTVKSFYADLESLFWDHVITIIWCSSFTFFGIYIFIRNYRNQSNILFEIKNQKEKALADLESLNLKKNQLIALLSHDLKNPIGTLEQTLDLVDQDAFEEGELESILKSLKNQSYHLSGVLNNTLNWVLAELEEKDLETERLSLYALTESMKEGMSAQAAAKKQTIDFNLFDPDQVVNLEASEIRIILKNLLDNAIKFTPVGGVIEFGLSSSDTEVTWTVSNEGVSIPEEVQSSLFDFKVKTTYGTMREKGTGIGLPLCKKIADKLEMKLGFSRTQTGKNSFFLTKKIA